MFLIWNVNNVKILIFVLNPHIYWYFDKNIINKMQNYSVKSNTEFKVFNRIFFASRMAFCPVGVIS